MKDVTFQDYTERMLRVLVYIQQNLDREITLGEIAGVACFSPYHFHRVFRGMVGETLQAHIRRIRLERAAGHLKMTDRPVVDIALEAGYESHEAFTRAFHSNIGTAPSDFRASHRREYESRPPHRVRFEPGGGLNQFVPQDTGGSTMKVSIENVEPIRVAFMRHVGPYDQVGETWGAICTRLGSMGLMGAGVRMLGVCHDDPDVTPSGKVRYDACISVDDDFRPVGEIGVQVVEGGDYAVTTHQGPYDRLSESYAKLCGEWLPRSGRTMRSLPCFEVYVNDPEGTEPSELLTDIYLPLESKGDDE